MKGNWKKNTPRNLPKVYQAPRARASLCEAVHQNGVSAWPSLEPWAAGNPISDWGQRDGINTTLTAKRPSGV